MRTSTSLIQASRKLLTSLGLLVALTVPATDCQPPPEGLLAWWDLDGDFTERVGQLTGSLAGNPSFVSGEVGSAARLNGSDQGYQVNSAGLARGRSELTLEVWVRLRSAQDGGIWTEDIANGRTRFGLGVSSAGRLTLRGRDTDGSASWGIESEQALSLDTWTHVAATYQAGEGMKLFINGVLDQATPIPALGPFTATAAEVVLMGASGLSPASGTLNGDLDEVSIYGRALSAAEIAALHAAGSAGKCKDTQPAPRTFVWTGSVSSDWHTPANWSPSGVPGAGDSATINGNTVSVNSNAVVGRLNLDGGTLQGAATLTVSNLTWTAGGMGGGGTTLIPEGGTAVLSGDASKDFNVGRAVENRGTWTWSGAGQIGDSCGVRITNYGRFEVQSDAALKMWRHPDDRTTPPAVFDNRGVFEKTGGSGEKTWGGVFNNHGTVRILSGSLHCGGTSSGHFEVAANSVLNLDDSTLLSAARLTGAGAVEVNSSSLVCASTNMLATVPTWTANGGSITFQTPCAIRTMTAHNGAFRFGAAATVDTMALSSTLYASSILGGAGVVTITNLSWYGGVMTDGGTTLIPEGGTAVLSGDASKDFSGAGRVVENRGTLTWSGDGQINDYCGVRITNYGRFEVQSDAILKVWRHPDDRTTPPPVFDNHGVFEKTGGSGEKVWGGVFNNHGTARLVSGSVSVGLYSQMDGLLELAGGDAKSYAFDLRGGELRGAGTLIGSVINHGKVNPGPSVGRLRIEGDYTQAANGVLTVEMGGPVAGTEFDQLQITGSATLDGQLNIVPLVGYVPDSHAVFPVVTCASRWGTFARVQSAPAGGRFFNPGYEPHGVVLRVVDGTPSFVAPSFNPANRTIEYGMTGLAGWPYVIEASTNLQNWEPVFTNIVAGNALMQFSDSLSTNVSQRFFRAVFAP